MHKKPGQNSKAKNIIQVISLPPHLYYGFKVLEHISFTISIKVFTNNITNFQLNEVDQPNVVQGRAFRWVLRWTTPPLQNIHLQGCSGHIFVSTENTHTPVLFYIILSSYVVKQPYYVYLNPNRIKIKLYNLGDLYPQTYAKARRIYNWRSLVNQWQRP